MDQQVLWWSPKQCSANNNLNINQRKKLSIYFVRRSRRLSRLLLLCICLSENGLVLALISVVSGEALAKALRVIADSTSTAVPSLGVSVSEEDIVT
jgi:hypothetical protein